MIPLLHKWFHTLHLSSIDNHLRKEEAGIVWRMERYGQRMNELMNLDSDASQEQFNYYTSFFFFTWC
jgi:hypothetical protein